MPAKECYHCGLRVEDWKTHDCWTTTEEKLTEDLPEDLTDAWLRLRETAVGFGQQRVYASHRSIMFSRTNCYFFVRPKPSFLEVCFCLGRTVKSSLVRKAGASSQVKMWHTVHVRHRDEVEAPLTDWLREAYEVSEDLRAAPRAKRAATSRAKKRKPAKKKSRKPPTDSRRGSARRPSRD
jgi:hypothetical protein